MRLTQLQYLIAVQQYGSMSDAAEHLYVSQPTISVAIRDLEQELGEPLVLRSKHGLKLTGRGTQVVARAKEIMLLADEIRQSGTSSEAPLTGDVAVGCTAPFCKSVGLTALMEARNSYPQLNIHLEVSDSYETIQRVCDGQYQIGIIHLQDTDGLALHQSIHRQQLNYGKLFTDRLMLVVRPGHPLCRKTQVFLSDLPDYPFVTPSLRVNHTLGDYYFSEGKSSNIIFIRDPCSLRLYVGQTDAIAIIPETSLIHGNEIFQQSLVPLRIQEHNMVCDVGWVTQKQIPLSAQKVLECLLSSCDRNKPCFPAP